MVRSVERHKLSKWMWVGMALIAMFPFGLWQGALMTYDFSSFLPNVEASASKSPSGYRFAKRALQLVGLDGAVTVFTFDGTTFYPVFTLPSGTKIRVLDHQIVNDEVFALVQVVGTGEQGWVSQAVVEPVLGRKELFPSILFSSGSSDMADAIWKLAVPVTADAMWMQVDMRQLDAYDVFQFRVIAPNGESLRSDRFRCGTIAGDFLEVKLPMKANMREIGTWRIELTLNERPAGVAGFRVFAQ